MATLSDSMVSSSARRLPLRMRPDLAGQGVYFLCAGTELLDFLRPFTVRAAPIAFKGDRNCPILLISGDKHLVPLPMQA